MNQLSPVWSVETLVDVYGWYAVTRLDGNPNLAAVAADARSMNSDLEQSQVDFRSVARANLSSASTRDAQKYQLDAALRNVRTAVLGWVYNRRRPGTTGRSSPAVCPALSAPMRTRSSRSLATS